MSDGVESGNACEAAGDGERGRRSSHGVGGGRWGSGDGGGGICLLSSISISYIYIGAKQTHMLKSKWISFEDKLEI